MLTLALVGPAFLAACTATASSTSNRQNGAAPMVSAAPAAASTIASPPAGPTSTNPALPGHVASVLVPLAMPAALMPFSASPQPGEGTWHAAGRLVDGHPAVYETFLTEPGSSAVAGVAWMDTDLLKAQLYSGSGSPGFGPWKFSSPIEPSAARSLVLAFNGGFKFPSTQGGYYSEGKMVYPLRVGGAALVIYRNGDATVGEWGRDFTMSPQIVAVRQDVTLLVDGGKPVPGLNPDDTSQFGYTLGNVPAVWRAGVGVTSDGALVFVAGPSMEVTQLAELLARAGCVRAMTMDINPEWTVLATYDPPPGALASPSNGQRLLPGMAQGPSTFFESWWTRDFVTMSAR